MKFSNIALSVVAVMGAVAVGGSWYTGKQAESYYHQMVEQANQQLKSLTQYGINAEIKDVKLERHFFSSAVTYQLEGTLAEQKFALSGNDTLYHGPFPLNRLAGFNLMPVLMSMENQLQTPEALKNVFGDILGHGVANVSYAGATDGEFHLNAAKHQDEKGKIETTPLTVQYVYDQKAKNGSLGLKLENAELAMQDGTVVKLNGVDYQGRFVDDQGYPYLGLGEGKVTLKSLQAQSANNSDEAISLQDMQFNWNNSLKGERTLQAGQTEIGTLKVGTLDLGKFKMALELDFDAKSANTVMPYLSDTEQLQQQEAGDAVLQLLSQQPKLNLTNLSLEKGNGKVATELALNLTKFDPSAIGGLNDVLGWLAQSRLSAQIDRAYLEEFGRQAGVAFDKLSVEDAQKKATSLADEFFASAKGTGIAHIDGDKISLELKVDNGKVILNGREVSEEEIQMATFILMMGLGSIGH